MYIVDLLSIKPIFLLGVILIGGALAVMFKRNNQIPKIKTTIIALLLYYYLCILFTNIVGIPTLNECIRVAQFGETFFNPTLSFIPFSDGLSRSFILNILLFIPFGFLCPLISRTLERARNIFLIGFSLSFLIEISQLFTVYRVTDINDILTNIAGTLIGYLCFRLAAKLQLVKSYDNQPSAGGHDSAYLPIIIIMVAFIFGFFS